MDLQAKIRSLPLSAGVYLYKNAEGEVIYVGKAKNLRSRVSSYFHEGRWEDAKTGTLVREADRVDYLVVEIDCLPQQRSGLRVITADRKSTRLNSSHPRISYAVCCLQKKRRRRSGISRL